MVENIFTGERIVKDIFDTKNGQKNIKNWLFQN